MKTLKFKTNIKCGSCIAAVTPFLNAEKGIDKWQVDVADPNKVLTVESDQLSNEQVSQVIAKAGYQAVPLEK